MFQGSNYEHRPAVIKPPCFQMTCPKWSRLESNDIRTLISTLQDTTQHQTTSISHDQISYTRTQNNSTSIGRYIPETGFHKKSTPHGRSNYIKTFETNSFSLPCVPTIDHTLKPCEKSFHTQKSFIPCQQASPYCLQRYKRGGEATPKTHEQKQPLLT